MNKRRFIGAIVGKIEVDDVICHGFFDERLYITAYA